MTDFNLSTNYIDNLDALLKRTKAKLKKVLALESEDNQIRRTGLFVNSQLQLRPTSVLDQQSMSEIRDSSSSQPSSTWCKQASFVERHMKM